MSDLSPEAQEALDKLKSTLQDVDKVVNNARVGISGDSGVGKTVLAMEIAQAITPPNKRIIFIDYHDGYLVMNNPRHAHLTKRAQRMKYDSFDQLHLLAMAISSSKIHDFDDVGCIVLDEVSSMVDRDLDAVTEVEAPKENRNPDVTTWPEYNIEKKRFGKVLDALCKLDVHLVFVSHTKKDKTPKGTTAMTPSFQQAITQLYVRPLHISGLLRSDLVSGPDTIEPVYTRRIQVHPTADIWGFKTRIQDLPVKLSPETLTAALKEFIQGKREASPEFDETIRMSDLSESTMIEVQ